MTDDTAIRQIQCPSCGAPIGWPEGETSMRCPYCAAGLERTLPPREENEAKSELPIQPQIVIRASTLAIPLEKMAEAAVAPAKAAALGSVVVTAFILVIVGIVVAVFLLNPNSPISVKPPALQVHNPFILIPGAADRPADAIAMSYDIKSETYAIGRLSVAEKKFIWRATPIESISDVSAFAASETALFLVENDTQLKALKLEDGSFLWQSELVDKLGYGDSSLTAQGDRVVALTQDYTLQAFDTVTGEEAWSRRLNGYSSSYIMLTHNVAVIDEVDEKTSLFILSLSDGRERQRLTPTCDRPDFPEWSNEIYSSSGMYIVPGVDGSLDSGSVYFLYGTSPSCVERWDLARGELAWRSADMDNSVPSMDDTLILVTPELVYYGDDNQLWTVNQDTVERKLLLDNEDYELLPLLVASDALIVRARRTRGSERFELWSVNPITGAQAWMYNLGESEPFQPPDEQSGSFSRGESAWDLRIAADQLVLFKAVTHPNQLTVEFINLSDGAIAQTYSTPIKTWSEDSYWMEAGLWQGSLYWAVVETKLMVLNTSTGEIQYSYP